MAMEAHDILCVPKDATEEQIRRAYKNLAFRWHPDRNIHNPVEATAKFVEINKANRTLLRNLRRARRAAENGSYSSIFSPQSGTTNLSDDSTPPARSHSRNSFQRDVSPQPPSPSPLNTSEDPSSSVPSTSGCGSPPRGRPLSRTSSSSIPLREEHSTTNIPGKTESEPPPKPIRNKLRKQSKSRSCRPDPITHDYIPKTFPFRTTPLQADPQRHVKTLRPTRPFLRGAGADAPKKWVHVLPMTLEETFRGKTLYFRVIAYTRSGRKFFVPLTVYVPPGSRAGDEIVVEGVGNERKDGTRQDISFVVKELKHPRFRRVRDDLWMDLRLPWVDELNNREGVVYVRGVDGQEYAFEVDYPGTRCLHGTKTISKAGMPRHDGSTRGKLVVRWKISFPSSWGSFKLQDVLKLKS